VVTFFTTAKAFRGHSAVIQRNALKSWTLLHRDVEVILFGDDAGAAEAAKELRLRHEPHVERNAYGTKRLDYLFGRAETLAAYDLLCYVNCDIILLSDFLDALKRVQAIRQEFLMIGRRWDTGITEPLDFSSAEWESRLRDFVGKEGQRRSAEWIDYFAFRQGTFGGRIPPFVVGRVHWDNWLVWKAMSLGRPVIDASDEVMAVHQNHDYGYHPDGMAGVWHGEEAGRNYQLAGGWKQLRTIADATERMEGGTLKRNQKRKWAAVQRNGKRLGRAVWFQVWHPAWFLALGMTRPLRTALGLRSRGHEATENR
jgi:hypothetical protein